MRDAARRPARGGVPVARARRITALLAALCAAALCLVALPPAQAQQPPGASDGAAAAQTLTWTAGDSITEYTSAPATAVAGEATLVFENSAATGNTTSMPHTLTFTTSDPEYNNDVNVNILANPNDANGGKHQTTVTLTPGVYHYYCAIPGHGTMQGELVVTGGGGEDTTAPEVAADVAGEQNADGAYVGAATVTLDATDDSSGVDKVEYALDGGAYTAYTAPVVVNTPGEHTVRYRATDKAGNVSAEKTETFTVVAAPEDTTPPQVTARVDGERDADGDYVAMATVTLSATDADSGVDAVEYAVNGGEFTPYTAPFMVHAVGDHTVTYRARDKAGNSSEAKETRFTIVEDGGNPPDPECPERDDRPLVAVGEKITQVPNREVREGCRINEVIEDERAWRTTTAFLRHVREVTAELLADGFVDEAERTKIIQAAKDSGIGDGKGYEKIFDGTPASFNNWAQAGGGGFELESDGTMTSSTDVEGMGMLWFPKKRYGDFSLKLQFLDAAPVGSRANSGVFVRFPDPRDHPEEPRPEWAAIKYGHEVQIFDDENGDQYKTGSVYGFDLVNRGDALVTPKGTWNDYEIRVEGQHYSVYRNGTLINEFDNTPGQLFSPPRDDDPGSEGRLRDAGYIGLQTHSTSDVVSFRDVRVKPL
ncbi:OmpL47-type beta-barrel domain-containing protein [Streptomyces daliensis]|uniref:DUF1080 domain-containing protein n=1 Tax=Streptomyces daliensis TaxID=299421 RepID=A0A8T4J7X8_9ACTN|nr:DUF1080 domain-containing protein [Streptomyces daliensis]